MRLVHTKSLIIILVNNIFWLYIMVIGNNNLIFPPLDDFSSPYCQIIIIIQKWQLGFSSP